MSCRSSWRPLVVLLAVTAILFATEARAHRLGESYLILNVFDDRIEGRVELHLEDVEAALHLDQDRDGVISESELNDGIEKLLEYVQPRVALGPSATGKTVGSEPAEEQGSSYDWPMQFTQHTINTFQFGRFVQLHFTTPKQTAIPDVIRIKYQLLFDHQENHRGLLVIESNTKTGFENDSELVQTVFHEDSQVREIDLTVPPTTDVFLAFIKEGIWHIWIGIDHILFLVALLLPSVRQRVKKRPPHEQQVLEPSPSFRPAIWSVIKIVTLFTLAHSITLALAALRIVVLPGPFVETIIAASIVAAALDNIFGVFGGRIGWVVFGFGLFHGLGFASVLSHLALASSSLVTTLLGFNLGVEIGQIAIICVVFPVLYSLRKVSWYGSVIQIGGSLLLIVIGAIWMVERIFDLEILGI